MAKILFGEVHLAAAGKIRVAGSDEHRFLDRPEETICGLSLAGSKKTSGMGMCWTQSVCVHDDASACPACLARLASYRATHGDGLRIGGAWVPGTGVSIERVAE